MPKSKATLVPDDELPANDPQQRCTGNEAVIRLVACSVSRCLDDPTFARRVKLADFIAEDAVSAVMDGNLLREFSPAERDLRIHELTRGWSATAVTGEIAAGRSQGGCNDPGLVGPGLGRFGSPSTARSS